MDDTIKNKLAAINAIKSKFTSTINKIYINSIQREVNFREITVAEQKKLARIMIDNENRKDIVYDAQCAILKSICLEDDFDIYSLSEFDKIKLLMLLYQRNMMKHEITFTCPECHTDNKYKLDFKNVIDKLDKFNISDKEYVYENDTWKFSFVLGYPLVKTVSKFYSSKYLNMRKNQHDKVSIESFNTSLNVDYINLFIKKVEFQDKTTTEQPTVISTEEYSVDELFEIISVFPQDVLYSERGIIAYITSEFISKINNAFEKHACLICGAECENSADQDLNGFF